MYYSTIILVYVEKSVYDFVEKRKVVVKNTLVNPEIDPFFFSSSSFIFFMWWCFRWIFLSHKKFFYYTHSSFSLYLNHA